MKHPYSDIKARTVDIVPPNVDVNVPNVDVKGQGALDVPKIKTDAPKIETPEIETPKVESKLPSFWGTDLFACCGTREPKPQKNVEIKQKKPHKEGKLNAEIPLCCGASSVKDDAPTMDISKIPIEAPKVRVVNFRNYRLQLDF